MPFWMGETYRPAVPRSISRELQAKIDEIGIGQIATVSGRYYAMDRDKRWERTEKAYRALVLGEGRRATSGVEAVTTAYGADETDEFVIPTVVVDEQG